jgi:ABC-type phosphate transport system substrate-binding protein
MKTNTDTERLYRIEFMIAVLAVVAVVTMSGTAAAAANSASISAHPNPVSSGEYTAVTGEIDLQALFFCGGYTLETHVSTDMRSPRVLSTNAGSGSLTVGYSNAMNEQAWRWDSGFEMYCGGPTKHVTLETWSSTSGYHEVAAGSDYFIPSKWEQARVHVTGNGLYYW